MKAEPPSIKSLIIIWLILVVLHFTILGLSLLRIGSLGTPLILTLAFGQMILVMLYFMELRHSHKMMRLFAAAGFFWLLLQFTLTASDYFTRGYH
jgi:cytochrome c oxidase subunit 4